MLMKSGGNWPVLKKKIRHEDAFSKSDHFLIKTFKRGYTEASSHLKLSLILMHKESCSFFPLHLP